MTLEEKLLQFREIDPTTGCWNWTRSVRYGYGQIRVDAAIMAVHRVAYLLWVGEIEGLNICHHCDNRRCFNPDHLFSGSHADNMADAVRKGRMNRGENNHFATLTWKKVSAIRALKQKGIPQRGIAKKFAVSEAAVSLIVHDHIWRPN